MACSEGFNTDLWGFHGYWWEHIHFLSKPRHVTPQIHHLGKMRPVLRVLTHIYGLSKEIDGNMFIFRVNQGMWPLKLIIWEKWALFWRFQHHLSSFQGDRWEHVHFLRKPRHVTPQIDHIEKMMPVLRVWTHIYGVSKEIDGKMSFLE